MVLDVVIVGGGIAGLMTAIGLGRYGHKIHIYERKAEHVVEGGAGIMLQPTAVRILDQWNLRDQMNRIGHVSGGMNFRRYANGELIARSETPGDGSQLFFLRSDLRKLLLEEVRQAGIPIHFEKVVVDTDIDAPAVTFADGESVKADLIIAADGIKSLHRQKLFPTSSLDVRRDCTANFQVPFSKIADRKTTKQLVEDPSLTVWFGPERCLVLSPVPSRECLDLQFVMFNFGLEEDPHPDTWNEYYDGIVPIQKKFHDFEPRIQELLDVSDGYWKWRHSETRPLPAWSSDNGKILLLGEAAHAIVPFSAHGAGMCIEDSAAVSELYRDASPDTDLKHLAELFEKMRRPRMEKVHQFAHMNRAMFGLPDGAEQEGRDQTYKALAGQTNVDNVKPDADAPMYTLEWRKWLDYYDTIGEAKQALQAVR